MNSYVDLFVPDRPSSCVLYTARTNICAHVKHPISICRKRIGLAAGGMATHKYCIHY